MKLDGEVIVSEDEAAEMFQSLKSHDWFRAIVQLATKANEWNTVAAECVSVSISIDEVCDDREDELTWHRVMADADIYPGAGKIDCGFVNRKHLRSE